MLSRDIIFDFWRHFYSLLSSLNDEIDGTAEWRLPRRGQTDTAKISGQEDNERGQ